MRKIVNISRNDVGDAGGGMHSALFGIETLKDAEKRGEIDHFVHGCAAEAEERNMIRHVIRKDTREEEYVILKEGGKSREVNDRATAAGQIERNLHNSAIHDESVSGIYDERVIFKNNHAVSNTGEGIGHTHISQAAEFSREVVDQSAENSRDIFVQSRSQWRPDWSNSYEQSANISRENATIVIDTNMNINTETT
jgi:hypothetical protein